ncbi:hypothetical protein Vretifemale_17171 [Volvox reticuliferus]|uniref:Uncharacterized protein n=1 Tax=Volvox reticuliferus TaxID=1737510 RepID=A0A8J4CUS2_9CHLO|nr:hypothetical protein Vretifemale_17171 [Volvox reticuliferus]
MPAVVNVGGPVAWGLVVFVSAWAIRTARALAGHRRARRTELEDEALLHDPKAEQPQYLQRLTATAIRMLIETGPFPCAVIELADGGCTASTSAATRTLQGGNHGTSDACQAQDAPALTATGPALSHLITSAAASSSWTRIAPPELSVAVPCMPVAAWVRALSNAEAWRTELSRAAAAATTTVTASPRAAGARTQLPHASSYGPSLVWDGGSGMRGRRSSQPARTNASVPGGGAGGGNGSWCNGHHVSSNLGGTEGFAGCNGGAGSSLAATTVTATVTAANMALPPYPPRHGLLVVLGSKGRAVDAVTAAAAKAGFSRYDRVRRCHEMCGGWPLSPDASAGAPRNPPPCVAVEA